MCVCLLLSAACLLCWLQETRSFFNAFFRLSGVFIH
jgi:hypothetical protein